MIIFEFFNTKDTNETHEFVRERVLVPSNKMNIVMQGMGYLTTSIEWNNTAASSNGTFSSFSVGIFGDSFKAFNISFKVLTFACMSSFCFEIVLCSCYNI